MKASALILIFSGLIGLNRCSTEINIEFPLFSKDNNQKSVEKQELKSKLNSDTLLISSIYNPGYYAVKASDKFFDKSYTENIL